MLIQHGSLLLDDDQGAVAELLLAAAAEGAARGGGPAGVTSAGRGSAAAATAGPASLARPATLRELLGRPPERVALEAALVQGFQDVLGIALAPSGLSAAERDAVVRWSAHFRSPEWTWRR